MEQLTYKIHRNLLNLEITKKLTKLVSNILDLNSYTYYVVGDDLIEIMSISFDNFDLENAIEKKLDL